MSEHKHHKTAFTLLEVLVVIALSSLLMGILLPSLSTARRLAQSTDCKGSLRSLGLAVQMYTNECNSYPPAWVIAGPVATAWCGGYYTQDGAAYMDVTRSPLWPYLQERKVLLRCQEFAPPKVKYPGSGRISGYGINAQYIAGNPIVNPDDGQAGMSSWSKPARAEQIARPGETLLFADCARVKQEVLYEEIFIYPLYKHNSSSRNYATFHFRHRGRANATYCDGHVDSIRPLELDPAGEGECGWMANDIMDRE